MKAPEGLLEVGRVGRPHGVKGDLFLTLTTDRVERAAVGSRLLVAGVWRTVAASFVANGRWRVHFDGVDGRDQAAALTGTPIYAEPIDDADVVWIHQLVGARIVEVDGTERGRCVAVIDNPAADILELDSGALVPATFIAGVEIDESGGAPVVRIEPPAGLFELYES